MSHYQYQQPGRLPSDMDDDDADRCDECGRRVDGITKRLVAPTRGTYRVCRDCNLSENYEGDD